MASDSGLASADKVVSIHYTLTGDDGQVLDRSGDTPLTYLHGHDNIVPGLEREIDGKSVGDKFRAVVVPADGYGERLADGEQEVPRDAFPEDAEVSAGDDFAVDGPDGELIPVWVIEVLDDHVRVDFNHPLAGKTLTFDVEVVSVRDSTADEQAHGHVHGHGGHHH
jgi:FKBP-type peptidyl-prolyl cis-trans isomerase SlyD